MESTNKTSASCSKRKPTESVALKACKAARVGAKHGSSSCSWANHCNCRPTRPSLAESCFNYLNSGVPHRIMYYNRGDWLDFPESVTKTLITGFVNKQSSITFSMGNQPLLLDFPSMVVVNLRARKQRSVAWIDEADKCYFPTNFDNEDDDSTEWDLGIMGKNRPERPKVGRELLPPVEIVKHVVVENGSFGSQQRPKTLRERLERLERDSESFLFVQKLFLQGIPFSRPSNLIFVHRCAQTDSTEQIKLKNFERQIKATAEKRGAANVQYAWYGAKKLDIVGVMLHGFGASGKPTVGGALGTGLYLTPGNRAFASVNLCDVDDKGVQHMLLCRTILGNVEQVHPGSNQYFPSSEHYDSGVDNALSPRCYVVWSTHLNAYVHPEYFVTFMLAPDVRDYLFGLKDIRYHVTMTKVVSNFSTTHPVSCEPVEPPVSPWVPFSVLFEAIKNSISPLAMELLLLHHQELKSKVITREMLVNKMRVIIGDPLLVWALHKLKRSPDLWCHPLSAKKKTPDNPPTLEPNASAGGNIDGNGPAAPTPEDNGATNTNLTL